MAAAEGSEPLYLNADCRGPVLVDALRQLLKSDAIASAELDLADEAGLVKGLAALGAQDYATDVLKPRASYYAVRIDRRDSSAPEVVSLYAGFSSGAASIAGVKKAKDSGRSRGAAGATAAATPAVAAAALATPAAAVTAAAGTPGSAISGATSSSPAAEAPPRVAVKSRGRRSAGDTR